MQLKSIFPLIIYLAGLIALVYITGISEELLLVFPLSVLLIVLWFILPLFIAVITALLSEYNLRWRVLYAAIASLAINFVLPLAKRRILIHEGFYHYESLRGFWSILQDKLYLGSFLIMFFVFWAGEEIVCGCKKELEKTKGIQEKMN
ncbi:MAG: hypothetical protein K6G42_08855 [Lachnospiraceae bacterium]|nr:hypothetical protein [Lachnospiraceae bacterium]